MSSSSQVVPAPLPDDAEDVRDALAIANTVWNRGEKSDAIGWIRRAAEAADEAGNTGRAGQLQAAAQSASNVARLAIAHPDPQELSAEIFVLKTPLPSAVQVIPPNAVPTPLPTAARGATPLPTPSPMAINKGPDGTGANRAVPAPSKPSADASGANRPVTAPPRATTNDAKKPPPNPKVTVPRATPVPSKPIVANKTPTPSQAKAPTQDARVGGATMPDLLRVPAPATATTSISTPLPMPTIRDRDSVPIETPSDGEIGISISLDVPNDLESTSQGPAMSLAVMRGAMGRGREDALADDDDIQSLDDEPGDTVTKPLEGDDRQRVAEVISSLKKSSADASGAVPALSPRSEPPGLRTAVALRVRVYPSEAGAWIMPEQPGDTDGVSAMLVALDDYDLRKLFPQNSGRKR